MANKFKNIRPLVIGIGVAGKRHLEAQLNLGIKTGAYTTNPESSKSLQKIKNVIVFDNLTDAINWSNLVHVCTPDDKHTEFVALALKNKKTVLCEKAFTTNLKDAIYLKKLSQKYNSLLIIGQNYRLTPTFQETKKLVSDGVLGIIRAIETTYLHDMTEYQKRTPARKNQDFLYIGGSHAVDLMCWIVGDKVVSVAAKSKKTKDNCPASYQIKLKFASGLIGKIQLDASSPRKKSGTDLIVNGEQGQLVSHNKEDKLTFYRKGSTRPQVIKLPNDRTHTISIEVKIVDDYLSNQSNSFWPLPGVDKALETIKILDAVSRATSSGKTEFIP